MPKAIRATMKMKADSFKKIILPFLILVFGISQGLITSQSFPVVRSAEKQEFTALYLNPKIIRRFLGTRIIAADLVWIDTLIKSDLVREGLPYTTFYKASKIMLDLDPDNFYAYFVLGLYLSVIKDDVKGATALLRDGAQNLEERMGGDPANFPKGFIQIAWRVYFALGYNLMFEEHEFEEGAKWIGKIADLEGVPDYIRNLSKRVGTEKGRLEVASRVLNDVYKRARSTEEQNRIKMKLLEIASEQELIELNEKYDQYLQSTGAFAMEKNKAFGLFLHSINHSGKDLLGRRYILNHVGKVKIQK